MCRDPEAPLDAALALRSRPSATSAWRSARRASPRRAPAAAHEIVDDWAELAPDAPAVVSWDGTLGYGELAERSDRAGRAARRGRCRAGQPGRTGRPPLGRPGRGLRRDPEVGRRRRAARRRLSRGAAALHARGLRRGLVVTDGASRHRLPARRHRRSAARRAGARQRRRPGAPPSMDPESVAYVIYTSGRRGGRRACSSPHRGLRALIARAARALRARPRRPGAPVRLSLVRRLGVGNRHGAGLRRRHCTCRAGRRRWPGPSSAPTCATSASRRRPCRRPCSR